MEHDTFSEQNTVGFRCDRVGCKSRGFLYRSGLDRHIAEVHSNRKPYACTLCEKSFKRKFDAKRHQKTVHAATQTFQCNMCTRGFTSDYALRVHKGRIHP
eukprot:389203_1